MDAGVTAGRGVKVVGVGLGMGVVVGEAGVQAASITRNTSDVFFDII
jgi:hypothetical protein